MTTNSPGAGPMHKTVEAGVTLLIALFGVIVIIGSVKAGINWGAEGPRAGFFPVLCRNRHRRRQRRQSLERAARGRQQPVRRMGTAAPGAERRGADRDLCRRDAVHRPLSRLDDLHRLVHALARQVQLADGRAVAIGMPVVTYLIFERWFLVPLPKGPVEEWLGL